MAFEVAVAYDGRVNLALQQNAVPVVKRVEVRNTGEEPAFDLVLSLWIEPGLAASVDLRLGPLGAGATVELGPVDLPLSPERLVNVTEREAGRLHVALRRGETKLLEEERPVEVLAWNEWGGLGSLPELLAAFVQPSHPALEPCLAAARHALARATGDPTLDGYGARRPARVRQVAAAVYAALQAQGIAAVAPPPSFESEGQKVRLADQVLGAGMGTCLDLSLLVSSCLEALGLYALVVLGEGHTFVGLWLVDAFFPEPSVPDSLRLRKRAELGDLCFFDAAALAARPPVGFAEAEAMAIGRLAEPEELVEAIDVRAARERRILPLSSRLTGGPSAGALVRALPLPPPAATLSAGVAPASAPPRGVPPTPGRLSAWKTRLLDLSLRNRLLAYRETGRAVPLARHGLPELEDALASGATFELWPAADVMGGGRDPRDPGTYGARTGEDPLAGYLADEARAGRLRTTLTEGELGKRLVTIHREARRALQEGGATLLYLALGLLAWPEAAGADRLRLAPILLLPLELARGTARDPFRLRLADEEPRLNVTLLKKLEVDFGLRVEGVEALPEDGSGLDVPLILDCFRRAVVDVDRFEVREDAVVGLFSFTKFMMWRDLEAHAETLLGSEVVQHIVEGGGRPFPVVTEPLDPAALDEARSPAETFTVVEADSSQLAAVFAADEGQSFVLEGPPGTGKSQTITNLVSHCLAKGKRVLFVSEKMAALEVVHARLKAVGLGPFCLELHSSKASKAEVVARLGKALEAGSARAPADWEGRCAELAALRRELDATVEALHGPRPLGESLFQVTGRLLDLDDAPRLPLALGPAAEVTAARLEALREAVARLRAAAAPLGPVRTHPFAASDLEEWSPSLGREVEAAAARLETAASELEGPTREAIAALREKGASSAHDDLRRLDGPSLAREAGAPAARLETAASELEGPTREAIAALREKGASSAHGDLRRLDGPSLAREAGAPAARLDMPASELEAQTREATAALGAKGTSSAHGDHDDLRRLDRPSSRREGGPAHRETATPLLQEQTAEAMVAFRAKHAASSHDDPGDLRFDRPSSGREVEAARRETPASGLEEPDPEAMAALRAKDAAFSHDDLRRLDGIAALLLESPRAPEPLLTAPDWEPCEAEVSSWVEAGRQREALRAALSVRFDPDRLLGLDLESLRARFVRWGAAFFLLSWLLLWSARRALRRVLLPGVRLPTSREVVPDLDRGLALRRAEGALEAASERAQGRLGAEWRGAETDWPRLGRLLAFCRELRRLLAPLERSEAGRAVARRSVELALSGEAAALRPLAAFRSAFARYEAERRLLASTLALREEEAWGPPDAPGHLGRVRARLRSFQRSAAALRDHCAYRRAASAAAALGLAGLVEAHARGELGQDDLAAAFDRSFYDLWLDEALAEGSPLRGFHGGEHEQRIQRFRELDARCLALSRELVAARLAAAVADLGRDESLAAELAVLRRETQKKRRHLPLRALFRAIPSLLPRLQPCLLMSPLSVAQYLDPELPPFDVVVFDEASQIPVWDAIGALARGRVAVVVGDTKQLPPTSFFLAGEAEDPAVEDDFEELESILEECVAAGLPRHRLRWHYRSRHESLIAFSNEHYYENTLLTFPCAAAFDPRLGLTLRPVPEGVYDRARSRTNRAEAEALVAEVVGRLSDPVERGRSLGVVTFSAAQQALVEDLLDEARRSHPELEPFFDGAAPEPVFVKNLENVQGDERDVILLSVCYGPDRSGRLAMHFGPLNRQGGERRLNVAVTRAREQLVVFSTLRPDQVDLTRTAAVAARHLRAFLEQAGAGPAGRASALAGAAPAGDEAPVARRLREGLLARGLSVDAQVGASGYRVDLAILDPEDPRRYLLGVETDGPCYGSAATARDRERLRAGVLEGLGWRLCRVWSLDYLADPAGQLDRVVDRARGPSR